MFYKVLQYFYLYHYNVLGGVHGYRFQLVGDTQARFVSQTFYSYWEGWMALKGTVSVRPQAERVLCYKRLILLAWDV